MDIDTVKICYAEELPDEQLVVIELKLDYHGFRMAQAFKRLFEQFLLNHGFLPARADTNDPRCVFLSKEEICRTGCTKLRYSASSTEEAERALRSLSSCYGFPVRAAA